ncbi:UDP-glucose--(heptosyl) LPS alpha 1,3-glucosyltransferase WaaG [Desulfuromonas versatilis]|uniref:UDP-glucose--(Heptosyl) LPS alpha 1,3-glucosyltransferase WaaG n=1 Tax=Desulfuromonas versatilis TaxID=2802975 RepID=A0ABN6DZ14_9BACT|nr:glycosyltransferase family 4 protein [Desulfuromonas versatilis]BCR05196.1 UDP-glucose--(heptosyl) LPS alpha 1,3-glucosyltransferase WaaG [Desulfuromonas versatilis]
MKFAFCLFKYFPFGGLQRDFRRIAEECLRRGHQVAVFTMAWDGEPPPGLEVNLLPSGKFSNHGRCREFARRARTAIAGGGFDAVVGFNKMPGLDVYFAADPCFEAKVRQKHGPLYRLGGRYRCYAEFERAVFAPAAATEILLISEVEKPHFIAQYGTPEERFHFLPPGIDRDRIAKPEDAATRLEVRRELGMAEEELLVLMVGSGFKTKGLDRALRALAALPDKLRQRSRLVVIGQGKAGPFLKLARKLGVEQRLSLLGGRGDVPRFLAAADLLLHPSYYENTGTVLVEALAAGLPVLATEICGYAHYVRQSRAGLLVPSPFRQEELDRMLSLMLNSAERETWRSNALAFAAQADIFSLPQRAADIIEAKALKGRGA